MFIFVQENVKKEIGEKLEDALKYKNSLVRPEMKVLPQGKCLLNLPHSFYFINRTKVS